MSNKPLAIYGARLIDPILGYDGPGGVLIQDGRIVGISQKPTFDSLPEGAVVFDAQGCALGPGFVDVGTRIQSLFGLGRETLRAIDQVALASGVTTLAISPQLDTVLDTPERIMAFNAEALLCTTNIRALGALTHALDGTHLAEIGLMSEQGIVALSDGGRPMVDSHFLYQALTYAAGFSLPVVLSCLDPHFARALATDSELSARLGLSSAPEAVEALAAYRLLGLAGMTGGKTVLTGVSVPHTLIPIADARDRGQTLCAMAQIHHLTLNEVDIGDLDTSAKFTPPLRAEIDRKMMVEGLREGLIDALCSGHSPTGLMGKFTPFAEAVSGIAALEDFVPAALGLYHSGEVELTHLWRAMSTTPAKALGLDAGTLRTGMAADLALVDIDAPFVQRAEALRTVTRQSAYDGRRLQGRVLKTWRNGRQVFDLEHEGALI
jgi:dihydroorotase